MSNDHQQRRERAVFLDALDRPAESRRAFVEEACLDDAPLGRRVLALLAAFEGAGDYLVGAVASTADALIGSVIGPYTLVEKLGEGAFGLVYAAEQREPLRRRVAIKLLKPGLDNAQVVARFEAERHALALMDHQNIARVIDGGATESGRPYFVMELVRGEPITSFCNEQRLTARERIELLVDVCAAVHHAHQKGIIHRDLKPSNILIGRQDGRPVAKVIDFGVAKATEVAWGTSPVHTEWRQLIGTPAYMSPEQAGLDGGDVDTRTDIYALGVLLYELLTGVLPLDPQRLIGAGLAEIQRVIREEEPQRPSEKLTTMGAVADTAATARRTDSRRLRRALRGDLDWIAMKALEKDRARRYDSAAALSDDLARHLRGEPVEAGPPSVTYRAAKFVRRHRLPVSAGAVVALSLVIALVVAASGLRQASLERDAAVEARQQADLRRSDALRMAERALVRSDFIAWGLGVGGDSLMPAARRDSLTVREMLDLASASIDRAYAGSPQRQALAHQQIGSLYHTLFVSEGARRELDAALALWRGQPVDRDDQAMAVALRDLLYVHRDLTATEAVLDPLRRERAELDLAILERRVDAGRRDAIRDLRGVVLTLLGESWPGAKAVKAIESDAMEALSALSGASLDCGSEELVLAIDALAIAYASAASRWFDPALVGQLTRTIAWLDERCPGLADGDKTIAMLHLVATDFAVTVGADEDALRLCRTARRALSNHLPSEHWIFAELTSLEGHSLRRLGHEGEAMPLLTVGCEDLIRLSGHSPAHIRGGVVRLLHASASTGAVGLVARLDTPLRPLAEAAERFARACTSGAPQAAASAADDLAAAIEASPRGEADPRPAALTALVGIASAYADTVSGAEGEPCRRLLAALTDIAPDEVAGSAGRAAPDVRAARATALWWLGVILLGQSETDGARRCFEQSLAIREADEGPDRLASHHCRRMLGRVLLAEGAFDAAATAMVEAYHAMRRLSVPTEIAVIAAARDAALGLAAVGRESDAADLLSNAIHEMHEAEDAGPGKERRVPPTYQLIVARPLALIPGLSAAHYERAAQAARRAIAGLPASGLARLTLGASLHGLGRLDEAQQALAEADEIDSTLQRPPHPVVALYRAASFRSSGRADEASDWFAEADRRAKQFIFDRFAIRSWSSLRETLGDGG